MQNCPICDGNMTSIGSETVLHRYPATYWQCDQCGFTQTENPFWLEEAYSSAITSTDIGYAWRCEQTVKITVAVLSALFGRDDRFVDYGGGYGLFTRMMRDRGFNFLCHDPFCKPIFANGCSLIDITGKRFDAATCFEVFEHLPGPIPQIEKILDITDTILFTTLLVSRPAPALSNWWYYSPHHGQHISFYTSEALGKIAADHGLNFYTNGVDWHLLTSRNVSTFLFRILTHSKMARITGLFAKRPSLLATDHDRLLMDAKQESSTKPLPTSFPSRD